MATVVLTDHAHAAPVPLPTGCAQPTVGGTVTCNYSYTGSTQTFTVPQGVESVTITAYGGRGATAQTFFTPGGRGGRVTGTFGVVPGDDLTVTVAGDGGGSAGGFGYGRGGNSDFVVGAGGGGGTAVLAETGDPLVVAGGGGGGGAENCSAGGVGGDAGEDGAEGGTCGSTAGGAGGTAGAMPDVDGGDARLGFIEGGGGGGGGFRGGSGGFGEHYDAGVQDYTGAGGGGGGTSYVDPDGTDTDIAGLSDRPLGGNGLVTIAYQPVGPVTDIVLAPATSTTTVGQDQDYTVVGYNAGGASIGDVSDETVFAITPDGSCFGNVCTPTAGGEHTVTGTYGEGPAATSATAALTVRQAPEITSDDSTTFTVGAPGAFTLTATGYPVPGWIFTSALPDGVSFDRASGVLSGTPADGTGGSYSLTFIAFHPATGSETQDFTLIVHEPPEITSDDQATFTVETGGSFTVAASGYPEPGLDLVGQLPDGVTFDSDTGVLSGNPAAGTGGRYPLTVTASNVAGDARQDFTLSVRESPAFTSPDEAELDLDIDGTFTITTLGDPAPTIESDGDLPDGLTVTDNRDGTATIAGTPTEDGAFELRLTATNDLGTAEQTLSVLVTSVPRFASPNEAAFTEGQDGSFTVQTEGYPPARLTATGELPAGLTFRDVGDGTGVFSGTPGIGSAGDYLIALSASNAEISGAATGEVSQELVITVSAGTEPGPTPTTTEPSISEPATSKPSTSDAVTDSSRLPSTGGPSIITGAVGLLLALGGGVLAATQRPRRARHASRIASSSDR